MQVDFQRRQGADQVHQVPWRNYVTSSLSSCTNCIELDDTILIKLEFKNIDWFYIYINKFK